MIGKHAAAARQTLKNDPDVGPAVRHIPTPRGCAILKFSQAASDQPARVHSGPQTSSRPAVMPRAACRVPRAACRVPRAACRVPIDII
jgi:hypothetical protein